MDDVFAALGLFTTESVPSVSAAKPGSVETESKAPKHTSAPSSPAVPKHSSAVHARNKKVRKQSAPRASSSALHCGTGVGRPPKRKQFTPAQSASQRPKRRSDFVPASLPKPATAKGKKNYKKAKLKESPSVSRSQGSRRIDWDSVSPLDLLSSRRDMVSIRAAERLLQGSQDTTKDSQDARPKRKSLDFMKADATSRATSSQPSARTLNTAESVFDSSHSAPSPRARSQLPAATARQKTSKSSKRRKGSGRADAELKEVGGKCCKGGERQRRST